MARFVMANRRAGKFHAFEKLASRAALDEGFNRLFAATVDVVNDRSPADTLARRVVVFDADPEEVAVKAASVSADVIVEPEILHFTSEGLIGQRALHGLGEDAVRLLESPAAGPRTTFSSVVTGSGVPLPAADVILFLIDSRNVQHRMTQATDSHGTAAFAVPSGLRPAALVVLPAGGHWSMIARGPVNGAAIECPAIAEVGPLDWWHEQLGSLTFDPARGNGIRVGVIDTGVGPHGCLAHVTDAGAFIAGGHDADGGADVDAHGTHVCGIIGARPADPARHRAGMAPGATLLSARVFPPGTGANQGDIANAPDDLSRERGADLVNMSFGARQPSRIELDAIRDALQRGTLCICAAGNDGGAVNWPAAFPETVAVSALGLQNVAPPGTLSATRLPTDRARIGARHLFLANFSSFGGEITCAAPGVGIVSTVPERFGLLQPYAVMDGTSMASPAVCGVLTALLAGSASYTALTGTARAEEARAILVASCQSVGLASVFQGHGMPAAS